MIIIGIVIIILLGLILFLARNEVIDDTLTKSNLEKTFYKAAAYIYRKANRQGSFLLKLYQKISKKNGIFQKEQVFIDLHTLEPVKPLSVLSEQYYMKKVSMTLMVLCGGGLLILCMSLSEVMDSSIVDGKYIDRYPSGDGDRVIQLEAQIGEEQKEEISLTVMERKYSKEELDQYVKELIPLLENILLGENSSVDNITKDMNLVSHIEGYPFILKYSLDNTDYMDYKGKLLDEPPYEAGIDELEQWNQRLKEGVLVNITVDLQYESYKREYALSIRILEKEKTKQQYLQEQLNYLLMKSEKESLTKDRVELPQQVDDEHITWNRKKSNTGYILILVTGVTIVSLYLLKDKELHDVVIRREAQLLMDYPEVISKITLLTGAGLTVRNSFYRIAREYQNKKEQGYDKHYAYEEILLTVYEMENGISEVQAYENFGKRCRIQQYIKLSALLVQNLKKSSSGLFAILQEEATDSFDLRKSMAKKLGEEAGTKLLLPMMMMLGIVMVIIFYPAMTSFAS